jgi:hypothetical protein
MLYVTGYIYEGLQYLYPVHEVLFGSSVFWQSGRMWSSPF